MTGHIFNLSSGKAKSPSLESQASQNSELQVHLETYAQKKKKKLKNNKVIPLSALTSCTHVYRCNDQILFITLDDSTSLSWFDPCFMVPPLNSASTSFHFSWPLGLLILTWIIMISFPISIKWPPRIHLWPVALSYCWIISTGIGWGWLYLKDKKVFR